MVPQEPSATSGSWGSPPPGRETPASRAYWSLVRRLVDKPLRDPASVERILEKAGRTWEELERDMETTKERRQLALVSAMIPQLENQRALADEGYNLIREAAQNARAIANTREAKALEVCLVLQERLEGAREAEKRLKQLLPGEVVRRWEATEVKVRSVRTLVREACEKQRNTEHLEAALEQAEAALRDARAIALAW